MKNRIKFFCVIVLCVMSLSVMAQSKPSLKYTYDKENVVASALDGKWKAKDKEITVIKDTSIIRLIPEKYNKFLLNKTIYHAGYITLKQKGEKATKHPFIIVEMNGNANLVYFRERSGDPLGDAESFILFVARMETKAKDLLILGNDFNSQGAIVFKRVD